MCAGEYDTLRPPLSHSTSTEILPDAPRPELLPRTLAALRILGYPEERTVKEEMRANLVRNAARRRGRRRPVFPASSAMKPPCCPAW